MALDKRFRVDLIHNYKFIIGKLEGCRQRKVVLRVQKLMAVMLGDRYGIGPEIVAAFLKDFRGDDQVKIAVVGDPAVFEQARRVAAMDGAFEAVADFGSARSTDAPWCLVERPFEAEVAPMGRVSATAGREILDTLGELLDAATAGSVDGILYAPFNKQALRDAGHAAADELDFAIGHLGHTGVAGEINTLGGLWTSRVTSHVPLKDVVLHISVESILTAITLLDGVLRSAGIAEPRIAVAGINPHAGDGGAFGREEIELVEPAIAKAIAAGIQVEGPFPSDTIFPMAGSRGYNAIVTMYHDQGQIALKLMGLGKGVTVLAGLPVPIATPAHGTAYDIAGHGKARADGLRAAYDICRQMMVSKAN